MLLFGYGITFDVDHVAFAVLDRDQTPESRAYIDEFAGSPYFRRDSDLADAVVLIADLRGGHVALAIEIPPGFGADLHRGRPTEVCLDYMNAGDTLVVWKLEDRKSTRLNSSQ